MKTKMSFTEWMRIVDKAVMRKAGTSVYDLPDMPFRSMYDDGKSPAGAASAAIKNAKEG